MNHLLEREILFLLLGLGCFISFSLSFRISTELIVDFAPFQDYLPHFGLIIEIKLFEEPPLLIEPLRLHLQGAWLLRS
jgi:hypothetical protein